MLIVWSMSTTLCLKLQASRTESSMAPSPVACSLIFTAPATSGFWRGGTGSHGGTGSSSKAVPGWRSSSTNPAAAAHWPNESVASDSHELDGPPDCNDTPETRVCSSPPALDAAACLSCSDAFRRRRFVSSVACDCEHVTVSVHLRSWSMDPKIGTLPELCCKPWMLCWIASKSLVLSAWMNSSLPCGIKLVSASEPGRNPCLARCRCCWVCAATLDATYLPRAQLLISERIIGYFIDLHVDTRSSYIV